MDTDFTHDPAEIPRLLHVGEVYDMVSGSRFAPGGAMQDVPHYLASLAFNWFLRILLRTQVQDNLGGYFVIDRKVLHDAPLDGIFHGYGEYFFRLLHFVQRNRFHIVEIPAVYNVRTSGTSKSSFVKMLFSYSHAALQLRLWGLTKP
jgi:dolichol-phosphate mannosyltransferase